MRLYTANLCLVCNEVIDEDRPANWLSIVDGKPTAIHDACIDGEVKRRADIDMRQRGAHPVIPLAGYEAPFRELIENDGNAFVVGGMGDRVLVLNLRPFVRGLSKDEVINLVGWLVVISGVEEQSVMAMLARIRMMG